MSDALSPKQQTELYSDIDKKIYKKMFQTDASGVLNIILSNALEDNGLQRGSIFLFGNGNGAAILSLILWDCNSTKYSIHNLLDTTTFIKNTYQSELDIIIQLGINAYGRYVVISNYEIK